MAEQAQSPVLVADIGGTNARFALWHGGVLDRFEALPTAGFADFPAALATYLKPLGGAVPRFLAIGAAGPIVAGTIALTNHPWRIDPKALKCDFGFLEILLANDLVAMAAGIAFAAPDAFETLAAGTGGAFARTLVIALGTGLGTAWIERGAPARIHASEAGHMQYAPATPEEAMLAARLLAGHARLSFENLASGPGLLATYRALGGAPGVGTTEEVLAGAESGTDAAAVTALELAIGAISTLSRNLVLTLGGVDEIVFAGGLGLRLKRELSQPSFTARLRASEALPLDLSRLALKLASESALALQGAAHLFARRIASNAVLADP